MPPARPRPSLRHGAALAALAMLLPLFAAGGAADEHDAGADEAPAPEASQEDDPGVEAQDTPSRSTRVDAPEAGLRRVLTIDTESADPSKPFDAFDAPPVKLFDLDGDGRKEIILHNDNRMVTVFDSGTGKLLAEFTTRYPSKTWGARTLNGVEAAILAPGEAPSLVVANSAAYVSVHRFAGREADGTFNFTKAWEHRLNDCYKNPGMDSKVVLADLDLDGDLEILALTEEMGAYALRHTGEVMWKRCFGGGNGEPAVGDLNLDGWPDVVWPSDGGWLRATDGRTGGLRWTFRVGDPKYDLGAGAMPVGATIAQLDGVGPPEVLVGVRDSSNCTDYRDNRVALFALRGDGELLWMRQPAEANPLTYMHPVVVDADRDGRKEIYFADWNTQGHKCGAWERLGPANVFRFTPEGDLVWRQQVPTYWSNKELVLADIDGDGTQEVVVNGPNGRDDGLWLLDAATGAKRAFYSTWPWKVSRAPVVDDLAGSGTMQLVVPVQAHGPDVDGGGVLVLDTGQRYRAAWPHPPAAVRGLGGAHAPGEGDPELLAVFELDPDSSSGWVELRVFANQNITRVTATVDKGEPRELDRTKWGAWAERMRVPDGARVVFRATSDQGETATSEPFRWT